MQLFKPSEYLKIDIANNFGLDKKRWSERIKWFDENEDNLLNLVTTADEPALFYAGVQAWHDFRAGRPSGYCISLDATSSGLQLLAALTCDRKAAQLCNVLNYKPEPLDFSEEAFIERRDGYTVIYNSMLDEIGETGKISRDDTKQAIMTSLYGSTAMPKQIFGEGALLDVFYRTMRKHAPGAWELNEAFLMMWQPDVDINSWVLPDNFHVEVKIMDTVKNVVHFLNQPFDVFYKVQQPMAEGRSLGANATHSVDGMVVREMTRRCDYDLEQVTHLRTICESPSELNETLGTDTIDDEMVRILWSRYKDSGFLSARIIQHLNTDNIGNVDRTVILELLNSLPEKPFKVLAVHDCFRCLPNYGNDLRRQYNIILSKIAKSNLLDYLVSQIIRRSVKLGKLDPKMYEEILDAEYALS